MRLADHKRRREGGFSLSFRLRREPGPAEDAPGRRGHPLKKRVETVSWAAFFDFGVRSARLLTSDSRREAMPQGRVAVQQIAQMANVPLMATSSVAGRLRKASNSELWVRAGRGRDAAQV